MLRVFNTVLQQLNNLVVVVSRQGEVLYVGPSVQRMLGYKAHELLGDQWWLKTCRTIADPMQRKAEVHHLLKQTMEQKIYTAAGDSRWFLWNVSEGPEGSVVKIGYDITERKHREQEMLAKNKELNNRNREIFESLEYARNIQQAILPSAEKLKGGFADAFVLYLPKDVVSGDFYWAASLPLQSGEGRGEVGEASFYVAVIDCTGHGVPGALMTIMANAMLKDVVIKRGITEPAEALHTIDEELQQIINAPGSNVQANDGMDIAFCSYEKATSTLKFAGAFRPMLVVGKGAVTEYRGSRYPIGFYYDTVKRFEQHTVKLNKGDTVYLFSDGYVDQFGGEEGKKFQRKQFKELLLTVQDMPLPEQKSFLEYALLNWRQKEQQTDDILVIALKV